MTQVGCTLLCLCCTCVQSVHTKDGLLSLLVMQLRSATCVAVLCKDCKSRHLHHSDNELRGR